MGRTDADFFIAEVSLVPNDGVGTIRVCNHALHALLEQCSQARRLQTPALAKWKEVEIYEDQSEFEKSAAACEELENMADTQFAARAIKERAHIYKDHLQRYDDAIKLFNIINDPPGTTWRRA